MRQSHSKHNGFWSHLMAYGASELVSKLSRLLVVVLVARHLGVASIGLAAAALAICDILKGLTENGIGQRIISASDDVLEQTCQQAHRLFWGYGLGLTVLQVSLGAALWVWVDPVLGGLVALGAIEYLFMPGGLVQAALAMRAGKLSRTAGIAGAQILAANGLTILLVFLIPAPIVLILPRVLTAPIWLIAMRRLHPWTPDRTAAKAPVKPFIRYGAPVLSVELVKALRLHADKLLVGLLLGAEGLGLYFMAFNAGLSLSTSFVAAFEKVVFPHLAGKHLSPKEMATKGLALISPVVVLQALLAPIYVPILLGPGWEAAVPVVSILCLCAIPLTLWSVAAAELRLSGKPAIELRITVMLTAALTISAVLTAPYGLTAMAIGYLICTSALLISAALPRLLSQVSVSRERTSHA